MEWDITLYSSSSDRRGTFIRIDSNGKLIKITDERIAERLEKFLNTRCNLLYVLVHTGGNLTVRYQFKRGA